MKLLQSPDTYATVACAILTQKFGLEFLEWDPAALELAVAQGFGVGMCPQVANKVQAAAVILTTDQFQRSIEAFTQCCNALNSRRVDFVNFIPADLDDVYWGVAEAGLLNGDPLADFNPDIALYTGYVLGIDGIYTPPSVLRWAQYPEDNSPETAAVAFDTDVEYAAYRQHQDQKLRDLELSGMQKMQELYIQLSELRGVDAEYVKTTQEAIRDRLAAMS